MFKKKNSATVLTNHKNSELGILKKRERWAGGKNSTKTNTVCEMNWHLKQYNFDSLRSVQRRLRAFGFCSWNPTRNTKSRKYANEVGKGGENGARHEKNLRPRFSRLAAWPLAAHFSCFPIARQEKKETARSLCST